MTHEYRPGTVKQYWNRVSKFLSWAGINSPDELEHLDPEVFLNYDDYLKENGVTQRHTHAFAIKALLEYYGLRELTGKVPARRDMVQTQSKWLPEPLIKLMLQNATDKRTLALTAIAYDLALRINEALSINITPKKDTPYIDLITGSAHIYRLKTRMYPWQHHKVSDWTLDILNQYCREIREETGDALFTTIPHRIGGRGGGRMSMETAERLWRIWMQELNLKSYEFKMLRHSRLTWMAVKGKNLIDIAKFAGHSSPNPTLIYTHMSMMWLRQPEIFIEDLRGSALYPGAQKLVQEMKVVGV